MHVSEQMVAAEHIMNMNIIVDTDKLLCFTEWTYIRQIECEEVLLLSSRSQQLQLILFGTLVVSVIMV